MQNPEDELPITQWLQAVEAGDEEARARLFNAIYAHLRVLAKAQRRRWQGNETIGTTALINEAFLKLSVPNGFRTRSHFFATASKAMRQILVTYAEQQSAQKRGGDQLHVALEDVSVSSPITATALLDLETIIKELEATDPRRCSIVECRVFGGMTIAETAQALDISPATVKREWRLASAWLTAMCGPNE